MKNRSVLAPILVSICTGILFLGCAPRDDVQVASDGITAADLGSHIAVLASDDFEGRKPCTEGERKTVRYLREQFERIGLEPAHRGSFFQDVPLVSMSLTPSAGADIDAKGGRLTLRHSDDFVAFTHRITPRVELKNSDLVFAGYGIVAPEYDWNDYEGLDVKGKTVLVLVNDPGYATQDASLFKGNTMTYYGRWTYKYEEAARQGAAGVLIVHDAGPAGYPWSVPQNGSRSKLYLEDPGNYLSLCAVEGWVTMDAARKIFRQAGKDLDALAASACKRGFKAEPLDARISLSVNAKINKDLSQNVMGVLPGSRRADECVVYVAHWDHLGIGAPVNGDSIYNGSADNAAAVAWMLEIAAAFAGLKSRPARSILFLSVTAEESGLLGSLYYVDHPVFPMNKTVAVINTDVLPHIGRMNDVTITGFGQSELDDYLAEAARAQNRYIMPDPEAHNGMYFRSDHFNFAKKGVPALFAKGISDSREHGRDWARRQMADYWANRYHRPDDEYDPATADLSGLAEDAQLMFRVGLRLSREDRFPSWKEGSEFKAIRKQTNTR